MGTTVHQGEHAETIRHQARHHNWLWYLAIVALILQGGLLFLALFEPGLPYLVSDPRADPLDSDQFLNTLSALSNSQYGEHSTVEVLANGENYYAAELQAIQNAQKSIHLEAYIFVSGEVTRRFLAAMEERARAGVQVRLVADAVGSNNLADKDIESLRQAGGKFAWYMPLRWYTWPRMNNRTHRELLIVDGRIGFIGGSGWADHWLIPPAKDERRWRDTMVRMEGPPSRACKPRSAKTGWRPAGKC